MWSGIIIINGVKTEVMVYETNDGVFKEWGGRGKIVGDGVLNADMYETEIGRIIISHIDFISDEFEFVGSDVPKIKI